MEFDVIALILLGVAVLVLVGGLVAVLRGGDSDTISAGRGAVALGGLATLVVGGWVCVYAQSVGTSSVILRADGVVVRQDEDPGLGFKAPWEDRITFDTFSQTMVYAGAEGNAPSYSGGNVNGQQITAYVQGGAATNFDVTITYNLDRAAVSDIYTKYRTQERFVEQIVSKQALSTIRKVPSSYSAVDFRGAKSVEAQAEMLKQLQATLKPYGVEVTTVALQNIRYSEEVEKSLEGVQTAKAAEETAKANLAAKEIEAKQKVVEANATAEAKLVEAKAEAEANNMIAKSLTPEVLRARWIDAVKTSGNTIVVPEGSTPMVQVPTPPAEQPKQ